MATALLVPPEEEAGLGLFDPDAAPATDPSALEAWDAFVRALFSEVFRPKPRIRVSEWAERNRYLSKETSNEAGAWRNRRTPYLVKIMDAFSDPEVREIVVRKSRRVGFTEGVIGNCIGYVIDQDPGPILVLQPTLGDAEDWSKKQLAPLFRDSPCLAVKIPESHGRDVGNTILDKEFSGGSLTIRGAKSPRTFRRVTSRYVFFDEVSAFEVSAGKEGDPVKLGEGRADSYPNRKLVKGSTPGVKGHCRISKDLARTDQQKWKVPCPHCGVLQELRWGGPDAPYGIKWDRTVHCAGCGRQLAEEGPCPDCKSEQRELHDHPETAYYLCEANGCVIEERDKEAMVLAGDWFPTREGVPGVRGFDGPNALVSLISDKAKWPSLVQEWLDAQGDPELLQVFINQILALEWEERNDEVAPTALEKRIENFDGKVPAGVGVLTGSVDGQGTWVELAVWGWGAREEAWNIRHLRVQGDPDRPEVWERLSALLAEEYEHVSGRKMHLEVTGIDSGDGKTTQSVYAYVKGKEGAGIYAIKGKEGRTPELQRQRRANKYGVRLWTIATWGFKDALFRRLQFQRPGPGYLHFCRQADPTGMDAEYFAQFGGEVAVTRGRERSYKRIRANEAIDLWVYARAALHMLGPAVTGHLAELADDLAAPITEEEKEKAAAAEEQDAAADEPRRRRRSGWATNW